MIEIATRTRAHRNAWRCATLHAVAIRLLNSYTGPRFISVGREPWDQILRLAEGKASLGQRLIVRFTGSPCDAKLAREEGR